MKNLTAVSAATVGDLGTLIPSWARSLRAANRSAKTISTYLEAANQFLTFLQESGMPTAVANIRREHVESFVERLVATKSPATANNRYRSLTGLFKWLVEDGEIAASPMERMKPPIVPEQPVPVLPDEALSKMLAACKGTEFEDLRDEVVLRLFIDTGMRLAEMAGLTLEDIDLDARVAHVLGKGRRRRACPFGAKTAARLDKYMRQRARRSDTTDALWIGNRGAMTTAGIRSLVERRAAQAGIGHVHAHLFRHLAAHHAKADPTIGDDEIMRLFGWRSREMLSRYASSTADERALAAYRGRPSLGDRF
jgi:site-specific recombinase XerD